MKETVFVITYLNLYESIISQLFSQGIKIHYELHALSLMSRLPLSWEKFVTTVYNDICLYYGLGTIQRCLEEVIFSHRLTIFKTKVTDTITEVEAHPEARVPSGKFERKTLNPKYKDHIMKKFKQEQGVEIFSPMIRWQHCVWLLHWLLRMERDVKTAFLHGDIDNEIYMERHIWYEGLEENFNK